MICRHCRDGADAAAERKERYPDGPPGPNRAESNRYNGLTRRVNAAHGRCPGNNWCDCQHRDTTHARLPRGSGEGRPQALVSAGFPPAQATPTPGVAKTTHRPTRRSR
jgi:hypothetical protein